MEKGEEIYCQFQIGDPKDEEEEEDEDVMMEEEENNFQRKLRETSVDTFSSTISNHSFTSDDFGTRPDILFIPRNKDACSGSLPIDQQYLRVSLSKNGDRKKQNVPRIHCSNPISAPPTPSGSSSLFPSSSWNHHPQYSNAHHSGSITSIDEAQEFGSNVGLDDAMSVNSVEGCNISPRHKKGHKSVSRLSLNLGPRDERALSPIPKSPSLIPKFLRNSFSKLMGKSKPDDNNLGPSSNPERVMSPGSALEAFQKSASSAVLPLHIPVEKAMDATNLTNKGDHKAAKLTKELSNSSPEICGELSTHDLPLDYFEETQGLPVIPFAYPTAVIAEQLRNKKQREAKQQNQINNKTVSEKSEPKAIAAPQRRDSILDYVVEAGQFGPASLDNLVSMAEKELESEILFGISSPRDCVLASSLAPSSCSSGGCSRPQYESDYDEGDELEMSDRRSRLNSLSKTPEKQPSDGKDDGYIEMIPKAHNDSNSYEDNDLKYLPDKSNRVKCLLSRVDSEEPFKMDLNIKG